MRKKIYVGLNTNLGIREIFRPEQDPIGETHVIYKAVLGPFKTMRAAQWYVNHPHTTCASVKEIERITTIHLIQSGLIKNRMDQLDINIFYGSGNLNKFASST